MKLKVQSMLISEMNLSTDVRRFLFDFIIYMNKFHVSKEWVIAGGFPRDYVLGCGKYAKDIDCYSFNNSRPSKPGSYGMKETPINLPTDFKLRYPIARKLPITLYASQHKDVNDLLDSFDFTICQFAIYGNSAKRGILSYTQKGYDDLMASKLVPHKISLPEYSIARLARFAERGFSLELSDAKVFWNMCKKVANKKA